MSTSDSIDWFDMIHKSEPNKVFQKGQRLPVCVASLNACDI